MIQQVATELFVVVVMQTKNVVYGVHQYDCFVVPLRALVKCRICRDQKFVRSLFDVYAVESMLRMMNDYCTIDGE